MVPNGLNKTVEKQAKVALFEKQLADWSKVLFGAIVAEVTIVVVMALNLLVHYTSDVPVESFRAFAYPTGLLAVFALIAALSIARHVDELKQRLDAARKG